MPKLDRSEFKYNAKVFEKTCLWCGTIYFASRSTAKYCSSTCRGYANQAKNSEEVMPYEETDKMISALLSENAYLKGQVQRYVLENQQLKEELGRYVTPAASPASTSEGEEENQDSSYSDQ